MSKLRRHWKKFLLGTIGAAALGYATLTAPVLPYLQRDLAGKHGTEQGNIVDRVKTVWGGLVWFPVNRLLDRAEDRTLIVNLSAQQLFVFDDKGRLEYNTLVSTGVDQGEKKTRKDKVTPPGDYILVRKYDAEELKDRFGAKAPQYGNGMLLFMGRWFPHIAIHGTLPRWETHLGTEYSSGCPRVDQRTIDELLLRTGIGSRLLVQEYGVMPFQAPETFRFSDFLAAEGVTESAAQSTLAHDNPHIRGSTVQKGQYCFLRDFNGDGTLGN